MEEALLRFTGEAIRVRGASRTDSGAHAQGQVVDFLTASLHSTERFAAALNFFLAEDIRVLCAAEVPADFNSRRSASGRVYQYRMLARPEPSALRRHTHFWVKGALDMDLMAEAAGSLVGTHDFRVLATGHPKDRSAVRTVRRWEVEQDNETVVIECEANGFLKQQIRRANGILLEIGKRRQPVEVMRWALEGNWDASGIPTLPARGLCLMEVKYPDGTFDFPPD